MSAMTEVLRVRLDRCPDPVATYAALCDNGRSAGTALLESAARGQGGTQRSVIALAPALRITLSGDRVQAMAMSANGRVALARLGRDQWPVPAAGSGVPCNEHQRLREPSPFDPLRELFESLAPERTSDSTRLMLIGAMSFELAGRFEVLPAHATADTPDYTFIVPELLLEIDHLAGRAELAAVAFDAAARNDLAQALDAALETIAALTVDPDPQQAPGAQAKVDCDDAAFARRVAAGQAAVRAGEVFQVVLSRCWQVPCPDAFAAYRRLRRDNPAPYLFYLCDDGATLFGASPESAVRFDARTRGLSIFPVAGTRARGQNADADARIEVALRQDAKELAEHMMLVDLARNDIARVCVPGSRRIPLLLGVDRYRHVMHLVSHVEGVLRDDLDALHALRACLNMGTLSGAPKLRATALIREVERRPRGYYGGAVGFLDAAGNLDTAITIRAATVRAGVAQVQAGAGVVLDSDPQREADETRHKARAVLEAIAGEAA